MSTGRAGARLKKIFAFIYKASNSSIDIGFEPLPDREAFGSTHQITVTIAPPLLWRKRTCKHDHALKQGPLPTCNGNGYCGRCQTFLPAELFR